MENKKKVEEVKQVNIKIDELRNKIVKISTEIYKTISIRFNLEYIKKLIKIQT